MVRIGVAMVMIAAVTLSACSTTTPRPDSSSKGGYYGGDSPPPASDVDFDSIPDAVPRAEPRSKTGNNPYTALGKTYRPLASSKGFVQKGVASWYGTKFHGRRTSSGETYDMWGMTAAHPVLPLPTYVRVTNLDTGRSIVVKVNDRGPFLHDRIIDLSYAAAHKLEIANKGTGNVLIRAIDPESYVGDETSPAFTGSTGDADKTYFVQVGAYNDVVNSISMRQRLIESGHTVYPEGQQKHLEQGEPYRVQVGPFDTMEQASRAKSVLENLLGQVLFIVTQPY